MPRIVTHLACFAGPDLPRRVQMAIEERLNRGWEVESTFVYKDRDSGVETVYVIFSRRES